jgi:hypothetical protein
VEGEEGKKVIKKRKKWTEVRRNERNNFPLETKPAHSEILRGFSGSIKHNAEIGP